ncbi:hypothetical protein X943_001770 [Babesia divergens]|uniref:Uncharacterized protein n=1 Tax=Babesia divergens TaxID=32595 RepID=A0AAD9G713_BABDI|nr:hypothetical protein X943_001770 [Babesia divergens]
MSIFVSHSRALLIRGSFSRGFHFASPRLIRCVLSGTSIVYPPVEDAFTRIQISGLIPTSTASVVSWNQCSRSCSTAISDKLADTPVSDAEALDEFVSTLDSENSSWWSLYVRGEVPDYPPRREMFDRLTAEGVDVERMEAYEIEDFTRWLLMRKKYGDAYPKMPYDVTLEQKISELKRRIPLYRSGDTEMSSGDAK